MRVWTLQEAGPHKTLIKCDHYEIVTMYTRRDLLEFIVNACNQVEWDAANPEREAGFHAPGEQLERDRAVIERMPHNE